MPRIVRIASAVSIFVGAVALAASVTWLALERAWSASEPLTPAAAFENGPLGPEFAPLKYVLVMHDVSREAFRRAPGDERPWTQAHGFLTRPDYPSGPICVENAAKALPVGISISNRLPGNNAPNPLAFVGLSCSACHSAQLVREDIRSAPIVGAGCDRLERRLRQCGTRSRAR